MKKLLTTIALSICISLSGSCFCQPLSPGDQSRAYWVGLLDKIAAPVIDNLSKGELKLNMPVETKIDRAHEVAYLEAFGRTLAGISPWLELGPDDSEEGRLRSAYIDKVLLCIDHATNPDSPDFMNFTDHGQPLVDAAFLAHGLVRAKTQIWDRLEPRVQQQVVDCLKSSRVIRTPSNNWLLFSGIIEAFLLDNDLGGDIMRIDYAVNKHLERYKGDGVYGDGENFHWDYYNSFVIQPMLVDIVKILNRHGLAPDNQYEAVVKRMRRYAAIQERFISPEGTFPPIGRSLAYRIGVFQALGQVALTDNLPEGVKPAQVRCAMTAVMTRMMEAPGTFDGEGWLRVGFAGAQPGIGEIYINTGSLYLCTTGLLALGLPAGHEFWQGRDEDWTSVKLWKGEDMPADKSMY